MKPRLAQLHQSGATDQQVVTWDAALGMFVAADAAAGGTLALDDLTDVDTTGVADGDVLTYDSGTSEWLPAAPTGGGGSAGMNYQGQWAAGSFADGDVVRLGGIVYVATTATSNAPVASYYSTTFNDATKWDPNGTTGSVTATAATFTTTTGQAGDIVSTDETLITDGLDIEWTMNASTAAADGFGISFLDPAQTTSASVGTGGGNVGLSDLRATTIRFLTFTNNRIEIVTNPAGTQTVVFTIGGVDPNSINSTWRVTLLKESAGVYRVSIYRDNLLLAGKSGITITDACAVGFGAGTGGSGGTQQVTSATIRRQSNDWSVIGAY